MSSSNHVCGQSNSALNRKQVGWAASTVLGERAADIKNRKPLQSALKQTSALTHETLSVKILAPKEENWHAEFLDKDYLASVVCWMIEKTLNGKDGRIAIPSYSYVRIPKDTDDLQKDLFAFLWTLSRDMMIVKRRNGGSCSVDELMAWLGWGVLDWLKINYEGGTETVDPTKLYC